MKLLRVIIDCILFIGIFYAPWWIIFPIGVVMALIFNYYIEIVLLGIIFDSLYNIPVPRFHSVDFLITYIMVVVIILIEFLKERTRFYS